MHVCAMCGVRRLIFYWGIFTHWFFFVQLEISFGYGVITSVDISKHIPAEAANGDHARVKTYLLVTLVCY